MGEHDRRGEKRHRDYQFWGCHTQLPGQQLPELSRECFHLVSTVCEVINLDMFTHLKSRHYPLKRGLDKLESTDLSNEGEPAYLPQCFRQYPFCYHSRDIGTMPRMFPCAFLCDKGCTREAFVKGDITAVILDSVLSACLLLDFQHALC